MKFISNAPDGVIELKLENGIIRVTQGLDSEYPGIDIEFIANNDNGENASRPRVIMEKPKGENVRVLVWDDPNQEDYTHDIEFENTSGNI